MIINFQLKYPIEVLDITEDSFARLLFNLSKRDIRTKIVKVEKSKKERINKFRNVIPECLKCNSRKITRKLLILRHFPGGKWIKKISLEKRSKLEKDPRFCITFFLSHVLRLNNCNECLLWQIEYNLLNWFFLVVILSCYMVERYYVPCEFYILIVSSYVAAIKHAPARSRTRKYAARTNKIRRVWSSTFRRGYFRMTHFVLSIYKGDNYRRY